LSATRTELPYGFFNRSRAIQYRVCTMRKDGHLSKHVPASRRYVRDEIERKNLVRSLQTILWFSLCILIDFSFF
jgi:hypothetical protein